MRQSCEILEARHAGLRERTMERLSSRKAAHFVSEWVLIDFSFSSMLWSPRDGTFVGSQWALLSDINTEVSLLAHLKGYQDRIQYPAL